MSEATLRALGVPEDSLIEAPPSANCTIEGDGIVRGKMDFNHKLTETTVIYDSFLIEAGSDNKFMQNDLGLAVKISDAFAVKAGFQVRHNSDVAATSKKTDRLFTTNLVYSF